MTAPGFNEQDAITATVGRIGDDIGFRSGIVRQYDGINVYVDISGQLNSGTATTSTQNLQAAAYLESYKPLLGDVVYMAKQGTKWVVLGRFNSVSSNNIILNPSFETDVVNTSPPTGWALYHDPSSTTTATASVASSAYGQPVDGQQVCAVTPAVGAAGLKNSLDYLYSAAFPVSPGQRWSALAYCRVSQGVSQSFAFALVQAGIELVWQANQADVPPTAIGGSGMTFAQMSSTCEWARMTLPTQANGSIVPSGANWARLILVSNQYNNSTTSTTSTVQWDKCIARQVT